jgi:hypothetical protein
MLWKKLKVGDSVRLVEVPPEFLQPGYYVHPETMRLYKKLIERRRPLRIRLVDKFGPWIHCKTRHKRYGWQYHSLLLNHDGLVRVKHRK